MLSSNPFYGQRNQVRQRNRADDMVFGLLPFEGMDAVAERLINVDYLLGDAGGVVARIGCQVLTQAFATTTDMLNAA